MSWTCSICGGENEGDSPACTSCGVSRVEGTKNLPKQSSPPPSKLKVEFINGPSTLPGSKVELELSTFPKVTIGRGTENVIIVPDPEVSRKHATLYMEGDELFLEDSSSTNGTYVYDGESFKKVEKKTKLPQGAVVKLGSFTTLKFTAE